MSDILTIAEKCALIADKVMGLKIMAMDWPCGYMPDSEGLWAHWEREVADGWYDIPWPVYDVGNFGDAVHPVPEYHKEMWLLQQVIDKIDETYNYDPSKSLRVKRNSPTTFQATWGGNVFSGVGATVNEAIFEAAVDWSSYD